MLFTRILNKSLIKSAFLCKPVFSISNFKIPLPTQIDAGNVIGLINSKQTPFLGIWEKLGEFRFSSLVNGLDQYSRQILFTIAEDWQWGLPAGIITVSMAIRLIFLYPAVSAQMNALKMKDFKPIMERYQQKMQAAQMSRNGGLKTQLTKQFNQAKKQRGIGAFVPMLNILQIPLLMTWFFSLRYITNLPQVYTQVQTSNFLWITDLSAMDPYFILPLYGAVVTSLSLAYSPSLQKKSISMAFMVPYVKYMKFLPFIAFPMTALFPAALNLYWVTVSTFQLGVIALLHTKYIKQKIGVEKVILKPKIVHAVFMQEKRAQQNLQSSNSSQTSSQSTESSEFLKSESKSAPFKSEVKGDSVKILNNKPKKKK